MNVKEATRQLQEWQITGSEQVVRRWIRQGLLKATMKNKKEGYQIRLEDLESFAEERRTFKYSQFKQLEEKTNKVIKQYKKERNKSDRDWQKAFFESRELKKENEQLKATIEKLESEKSDLEFAKSMLEIDNKRLKSQVEILKRLSKGPYVTSSNIKTMFGDQSETRKVFRKIVGQLHPDRSGDEELFKKVKNVYEQEFR